MATAAETVAALEAERERVAKELLAMRKLPLAQRDERAYEEASARLSALMRQIADLNEQQDEEEERKETSMSTKKATAKKQTKTTKPTKPAKGATKRAPVATVAARGEDAPPVKGKPAPAAKGRTVARDPRLPAPGTVLQKTDRHGKVRCECTVEEDGVRYAGKLYSSISGAGLAASKDLGLKGTTVDGYHFWGLSKPKPAGDLMASVEAAWTRYCQKVERLVKDGVTDENRDQVAAALAKHVKAIEAVAKGRATEAR